METSQSLDLTIELEESLSNFFYMSGLKQNSDGTFGEIMAICMPFLALSVAVYYWQDRLGIEEWPSYFDSGL